MGFENGGSPPKRVTDLSFAEIREFIKKRPYLLLPVGNLEPIGNFPLGTLSYITERLAEHVCVRSDILMAPLFSYGCATPYISFAGCSGLHAATLAKSMYDCCNGWFFNGIERIIIVTCSMDGSNAINPGVQRFDRHPLHKNAVMVYSLQEDAFFRSFCKKSSKHSEVARSEWGIMALMHYCNIAGIRCEQLKQKHIPLPAEITRWKKCGRDPEKLRKMAPEAIFNSMSSATTQQGNELFHAVTEDMTKQILSFLTLDEHAA